MKKLTRKQLRKILFKEAKLLKEGRSESAVPDLEQRLDKIDSQVKRKGKHVILTADALGGLKEILRLINNNARLK